jgi:hypothetical protein
MDTMKTDKQFAELAWDPSINATQIGVEVKRAQERDRRHRC